MRTIARRTLRRGTFKAKAPSAGRYSLRVGKRERDDHRRRARRRPSPPGAAPAAAFDSCRARPATAPSCRLGATSVRRGRHAAARGRQHERELPDARRRLLVRAPAQDGTWAPMPSNQIFITLAGSCVPGPELRQAGGRSRPTSAPGTYRGPWTRRHRRRRTIAACRAVRRDRLRGNIAATRFGRNDARAMIKPRHESAARGQAVGAAVLGQLERGRARRRSAACAFARSSRADVGSSSATASRSAAASPVSSPSMPQRSSHDPRRAAAASERQLFGREARRGLPDRPPPRPRARAGERHGDHSGCVSGGRVAASASAIVRTCAVFSRPPAAARRG